MKLRINKLIVSPTSFSFLLIRFNLSMKNLSEINRMNFFFFPIYFKFSFKLSNWKPLLLSFTLYSTFESCQTHPTHCYEIRVLWATRTVKHGPTEHNHIGAQTSDSQLKRIITWFTLIDSVCVCLLTTCTP